jgi:hypothetical protein
MDKRFGGLAHCIDKRVGIAEGLLAGFSAPIPEAALAALLEAFLG